MIPGKATAKGTAEWAKSHPHLTYNPLDKTGLLVSEAGFGCYRVDGRFPHHRDAMLLAIQQGINLLDTSTNYADGGSEKLVGQVLAELIARGEVTREAIVVVSKAGYIQGENYNMVQARKQEGRPFPNVVKYAQGLDHCIHPEFLADQLDRSLNRLGLETIDCYLLHNPEYYLTWANRVGIPLAEARAEFYRRIEMAFQHLEEAVKNGRIQWYGISANTFPQSPENPAFVSLEKVWQIATTISANHHFRVIQFPMNLLETGGLTVKNQSGQQSVLELAHKLELGVLINRPLNAIQHESLIRLADVLTPSYPATPEEVSTAVDTSVRIESEFRHKILPILPFDEETKQQLLEYLAVGIMLEGNWGGFGTYHNWRDVKDQFLLPRAQTAVQFLSKRPNLPAEVISWLHEYVDAVNDTFSAVSAFYQEMAANRARRLRETAVSADTDWQAATLSQIAVRALRSTTGITAVLVGMRHKDYVNDILADLKNPVSRHPRTESWSKITQATP